MSHCLEGHCSALAGVHKVGIADNKITDKLKSHGHIWTEIRNITIMKKKLLPFGHCPKEGGGSSFLIHDGLPKGRHQKKNVFLLDIVCEGGTFFASVWKRGGG